MTGFEVVVLVVGKFLVTGYPLLALCAVLIVALFLGARQWRRSSKQGPSA
jgi:hypothetical protein